MATSFPSEKRGNGCFMLTPLLLGNLLARSKLFNTSQNEWRTIHVGHQNGGVLGTAMVHMAFLGLLAHLQNEPGLSTLVY